MSRRFFAVLPLALALTLAGAIAPAAAHTAIEGTVPADGETVTVLPEFFSVTASEQLNDLTGNGDGFALHIIGPDGARLDTGDVIIEGQVASTPAVVDEPGTYTFAYQVVGEDGHPVAGEIAFVWAPDGVDAGTNAADAPAPSADGAPGWLVISGIVLAVMVVIAIVILLVIVSRRRNGR